MKLCLQTQKSRMKPLKTYLRPKSLLRRKLSQMSLYKIRCRSQNLCKILLQILQIKQQLASRKKRMKKMKMKNARAYINVQNPFTFTDYLGPDPETIGEDVYKSLSLYPMTFTFGVNLTF